MARRADDLKLDPKLLCEKHDVAHGMASDDMGVEIDPATLGQGAGALLDGVKASSRSFLTSSRTSSRNSGM